MKILVIGSNGREHVLAEKYAESKGVSLVFIAPGNGLTDFGAKKIRNVPILMNDLDALVNFAKKEKIDLVDVAQDDCLAQGYVDRFQEENISVFGPTQKAAQIEWSKEWSRNFMQKYNLPIPFFKSFRDQKSAIDYINSSEENLFYIKASGLATGKGAIKAESKNEAISAIKSMSQFGKAGKTFLIEECLQGEEFSLFAFCDGKNYVIAKAAQDHKTVYEKNKGPNTGGIGCVGPSNVLDTSMIRIIEAKIIKPFLKGMEREGRPYSGILYLGGILTKKGIKIIEFNARWGDPEAEVILPSIKTDYLDIVTGILKKRLNKKKIKFDKKVRVSIAGCSRGYPNDYSDVKGKEIFGINKVLNLKNVSIFGAGIKRKGKKFFADGGRIFHLVAEGKDVIDARRKAHEAMSLIYVEGNNLHYRTDIGWQDLEREIK